MHPFPSMHIFLAKIGGLKLPAVVLTVVKFGFTIKRLNIYSLNRNSKISSDNFTLESLVITLSLILERNVA